MLPDGWEVDDPYFYPRPPRGGRPKTSPRHRRRLQFLSTPSARRATTQPGKLDKTIRNFYPRPPRGGRRQRRNARRYQTVFLSTPSARRATLQARRPRQLERDFYPRPPRGGRPVVVLQHSGFYQFLSTPSARRATPRAICANTSILFLSTPSARRATRHGRHGDTLGHISIHALREEGDRATTSPRNKPWKISIHALREEGDLWERNEKGEKVLFLSTPSARRATTGHG